mgnify:CR=1 FL=1
MPRARAVRKTHGLPHLAADLFRDGAITRTLSPVSFRNRCARDCSAGLSTPSSGHGSGQELGGSHGRATRLVGVMGEKCSRCTL